MPETAALVELIIVLAAMVAIAALFARLRLGPVLGYLTAGIVIGPAALGLVSGSQLTSILGELGVVFLLFMIGLELPIRRIRTIGGRILAMGVFQVVATMMLIAWLVIGLGGSLATALAVGAGLSLSSTTIVLRQLTERGQLTSRSGRAAFAVLMIQDLLVGPLLVAILALGEGSDNLAAVLALALLKAIAAVAAIFLVGGRILGWIYRPIAAVDTPELFTGLSVLVVIGMGYLTHAAGLSLAFGGFLAGVLLADTPYRHQVAADIRPFRGLLLGVFFVAVGLQLEPAVLWQMPGQVAVLTAALMAGKAVIIIALALAFGIDASSSWRTGILLSQGGEFAFVLWQAAGDAGVMNPELSRLLIVVVAVSMALTPLLFALVELVGRRPAPGLALLNDPSGAERLEDHVVVIGCGTVGRHVVSGLMAEGLTVVALDNDGEKVRRLRTKTELAFFGDAMQPEMLEMMHVERALAVIVALDNPRQGSLLVGLLRYLFEDLPILARAHDEAHGIELTRAGATTVVPEVIDTGRHLVAAMMVNQPADEGVTLS